MTCCALNGLFTTVVPVVTAAPFIIQGTPSLGKGLGVRLQWLFILLLACLSPSLKICRSVRSPEDDISCKENELYLLCLLCLLRVTLYLYVPGCIVILFIVCIYLILCVCVCTLVYICASRACRNPWRTQEVSSALKLEIQTVTSWPRGFWELNLVPLQKRKRS